jgi:hypothetical protein
MGIEAGRIGVKVPSPTDLRLCCEFGGKTQLCHFAKYVGIHLYIRLMEVAETTLPYGTALVKP